MNRVLTSFIQKELRHLDRLSLAARRMLLSNIFYQIGIPVLLTFTNAFILKATGDFNAIAFFMLGTYITVVIGFYLNGWLLKFFSIKRIFTVGLAFQGLFTLPIFFVDQLSLTFVFIIGLILGFPIAMYWANRNFLGLTVTSDSNRNYYAAVESFSSTFIGILIPPALGFLIVSATYTSLYGTLNMYRFLTLAATAIMTAGGFMLRNRKSPSSTQEIRNPVIQKHFLTHVSYSWKQVRWIQVIWGFQNGINIFLPGALIIFLVGNEATLGSLQGVTALLAAATLYALGKKTEPRHRLPQIMYGLTTALVSTLLFSFFYTSWAVIVYVLGITVAGSFIFTALYPSLQKVLDDEEGGDSSNNYAYVTDLELFLNLGRALGIMLFYFLSKNFDQALSLRITPSFIGLAQLGLIYLVKSIPFNNASATLSKKVK